MAACGFSRRRVRSCLNFNCNFYQRHCVIAQSYKKCVIFSPKELQKEQDGVVECPKPESFFIQIQNICSILYWNSLKYVFVVIFRGNVWMTLQSNSSNQTSFQIYLQRGFVITWRIYNAVKFSRLEFTKWWYKRIRFCELVSESLRFFFQLPDKVSTSCIHLKYSRCSNLNSFFKSSQDFISPFSFMMWETKLTPLLENCLKKYVECLP